MELTVHLATDHAGFAMKEFIKEALLELGYLVVDHGAYELDDDDDYNDFIALAAQAVVEGGDSHRAIIFGGSGQGEAMMANRFLGIRATVYYRFDPEIIKVSREHNNANVLSVGARFLSEEEVIESALFWLEMPFSEEERHQRRNLKLDEISLEETPYEETQ